MRADEVRGVLVLSCAVRVFRAGGWRVSLAGSFWAVAAAGWLPCLGTTPLLGLSARASARKRVAPDGEPLATSHVMSRSEGSGTGGGTWAETSMSD